MGENELYSYNSHDFKPGSLIYSEYLFIIYFLLQKQQNITIINNAF